MGLYKTLILIKSIPIVQEVYSNILKDSEISYQTILNYSILAINDKEHDKASKKESNTKAKGLELLKNVNYAETSLIFNLCIYRELGNTKNNLICMYALSPTLFELLTGKLSPCNWHLAECFANIQYAILNRLYSHCSRYNIFF